MRSPHDVTREFEAALCEYTGARYAVACTSCTAAIQGALAWVRYSGGPLGAGKMITNNLVRMPSRSYVGVPAAIRNAGFVPVFENRPWQGMYRLEPTWVIDSARRFTSGMYVQGSLQCVSFHATKILSDSQGGAVLLDDGDAAAWLRSYFFDGRAYGADPKADQVMYPSMHAYMSPDVAARLLWKLHGLPKNNADLPCSDYPDLSQLKAFQ